MKKFFYVTLVVLTTFGCGSELTKEQREKLKSGMKLNQIQRVTPPQLTEQAFIIGKSIGDILVKRDPYLLDNKLLDSLQHVFEVKIVSLKKSSPGLSSMETQIVEAYDVAGGSGDRTDNVQKIKADSLLYTLPVTYELPDGTKRFSHAIGIRMSVKKVVLSIEH